MWPAFPEISIWQKATKTPTHIRRFARISKLQPFFWQHTPLKIWSEMKKGRVCAHVRPKNVWTKLKVSKLNKFPYKCESLSLVDFWLWCVKASTKSKHIYQNIIFRMAMGKEKRKKERKCAEFCIFFQQRPFHIDQRNSKHCSKAKHVLNDIL